MANPMKKAISALNRKLAEMGKTYFDSIPVADICAVLVAAGFRPLEDGIYCGATGECHEAIGAGAWFRMQWYKMGSGRYEITAYVS
jgi:hypothetical protein